MPPPGVDLRVVVEVPARLAGALASGGAAIVGIGGSAPLLRAQGEELRGRFEDPVGTDVVVDAEGRVCGAAVKRLVFRDAPRRRRRKAAAEKAGGKARGGEAEVVDAEAEAAEGEGGGDGDGGKAAAGAEASVGGVAAAARDETGAVQNNLAVPDGCDVGDADNSGGEAGAGASGDDDDDDD